MTKKQSLNHADFSGKNNPNYGNHLSEETKNKIRQKALGRIASLKTRNLMSKQRLGNNFAFKGDAAINDETYRYRARKIIVKYLRRQLRNNEVVHHIDGNPRNNKIENLYLFPNNGIHSIYHQQLRKYVKEMIL